MGDNTQLQFVPFASALDTGFWYQLTQRKLDVYKLSDSAVDISGYYACNASPGMPSLVNVSYTAFDCDFQPSSLNFPLRGVLLNANTLSDFKDHCQNKLNNIIETEGGKVWNAITTGEAITDPSLLLRFFMLSFADLKKYSYYYWFAFPAVCYPEQCFQVSESKHLNEEFSNEDIVKFHQLYQSKLDAVQKTFFVVQKLDDGNLTVLTLSEFSSLECKAGQFFLGFSDPSTLPKNPGWPLRNFLALVAYHFKDYSSEWKIICYRDQTKPEAKLLGNSIVLHVRFSSVAIPDKCKFVGWEKNESNKFGPRLVNLGQSMDPVKLSESAVGLNLKLMKWQLVPSLNLEDISETKCLLLGSGTLGCNVARSLLSWGIRTITLVDNSKVSYSNPVRQSLFKFSDCLNGGTHKAIAAANALKEIFPMINATAVDLTIPMPGHSVSKQIMNEVRENVSRLEELVEKHDVIFLLLDTREARWLPTVLGAVKGKIIINAALGFDTFLVMRHGVQGSDNGNSEELPKTKICGSQLGCYFCNDVVGPGDSTKDRTLDQQCTVTRPGVSMMAAALAVELMVNITQHPLRGHAPADIHLEDSFSYEYESVMGLVPHQIRGFLARFNYMVPACAKFSMCTACSDVVVRKYREEGFEFLLNAFNNSSYLEDLTGLSQLHSETDENQVWALSDEDDV